MSASDARVPCTIITGFLGAGKTTLLRHLLQNAGGRQIAIIINEFGDVGVDAQILDGCGDAACPADRIIELANGCLCCTVADDFAPALDALLARSPRPDHILIETSGLALPKPLVQAFQWPNIRSRVTVDGVITVADGAALAAGHHAHDEDAVAQQRAADPSLDHDDPVSEVFEDQIACADLVILNKVDLLDTKGIARAVHEIEHALRDGVKILKVANGQVDAAALLGLGLNVEDVIDNRPTHHDSEEDHDHDDFESIVVNLPEVTDPALLAARVTQITAQNGVLRVKGFAAVAGKPMRLLVQAVGPRVAHHYDRAWAAGESRQGQMVVIGLKGLDRAALEKTLAG
jgi:cobalamin biosynthesis protein CobW